jgi:hypothetical protein
LTPNGLNAGGTARKLARMIYRLAQHGEAHVRQGLEDCEEKFQAGKSNALQKAPKASGLELVSQQARAHPVS